MRALVLALSISVHAPAALAQSPAVPLPDPEAPLACMAAVQPLPSMYRSRLEPRCFEIGQRVCEIAEGVTPVACLQATMAAYRDFYAVTRPRLPSSIEDVPMQAVLYERGLGRLDSAFRAQKSCSGLTPWDEALCHYYDLSAAVADIFLAARRAGVRLAP